MLYPIVRENFLKMCEFCLMKILSIYECTHYNNAFLWQICSDRESGMAGIVNKLYSCCLVLIQVNDCNKDQWKADKCHFYNWHQKVVCIIKTLKWHCIPHYKIFWYYPYEALELHVCYKIDHYNYTREGESPKSILWEHDYYGTRMRTKIYIIDLTIEIEFPIELKTKIDFAIDYSIVSSVSPILTFWVHAT